MAAKMRMPKKFGGVKPNFGGISDDAKGIRHTVEKINKFNKPRAPKMEIATRQGGYGLATTGSGVRTNAIRSNRNPIDYAAGMGTGVNNGPRLGEEMRYQKRVGGRDASDSGLFSAIGDTPKEPAGPITDSYRKRQGKEKAARAAEQQPSGPTINAGMDDRGFHDTVARNTKAGYQNSGDLKNVMGAGTSAWSNLKGKDSWQSVAGAAGMGAVAGGLTGAGINTLRGEDAWDGAKSGAFMGAVTMGGIKGVRTATGATAKQTIGESISSFNQKTGLTPSVKRIFDNEKAARVVEQNILKNRG